MQLVSAAEKHALEQKRQDFFNARTAVEEGTRRAGALGDLSENAEYHFAKEENRNIQRELAELEMKLRRGGGVSSEGGPDDMVYLGHTVKLLDMDDDSETLIKLVGEASSPADGDVMN